MRTIGSVAFLARFMLCGLLMLTLVAAIPARSARLASLEGIPKLSHVFVIMLENESYDATWGPNSPAHYLNSLRSSGVLLTQYYGAAHLSNPNYISNTSGQQPNPDTQADCQNWLSCVQSDSSPANGGGVSIADQLEASGLSWKGYMEDMPAPCTHASATDLQDPYQGDSTRAPGYNYADRHNPFIYYAPIVNNATRCASHVVPYPQLAGDFAKHVVPNYAYIVPNTCHDGHDTPACADGSPGGLVAADAWLQRNVPPILSYVNSHNGLLAITFDEASNTDTSGCCGAGYAGGPGFGGRVGMLALSPHIAPGTQNSTPYDHASLLRTVEDAFGIATHLNNAASPNERAMTDVFNQGTNAATPAAHVDAAIDTASATNATLLPNGRLVTPVGSQHALGDFPLGVAVSPDGTLVAAINSGQGYGLNDGMNSYCTSKSQGDRPCPYTNPPDPTLAATAGDPNTHTADESISVLNTATGQVSEVKAVPTSYDHSTLGTAQDSFNFFYCGLAFSPDGRHLYAAGGGNDAVYDFPVANGVVGPQPAHTVVLPTTVGSVLQYLPSGIGGTAGGSGFTKGLAVTPDGRYLLVTHELNNSLDVVDTTSYAATQLYFGAPLPAGGSYPYGVAVSPDGGTAYVALQGSGAVAVVTLSGGRAALTGTIPVGDHPTAVSVSPDGSQLYVTNADDDTLSIILTATRSVANTLHLHALAGESIGAAPNALAVSPDGQRVYVALAGDNAVAVIGTQTSLSTAPGARVAPSPDPLAFRVGGLLPAAWYPSGVATSPSGGTVYIVSAKGLGSRPAAITGSFTYDGNNMPGLLQAVAAPVGNTLSADTAIVQRNIQSAASAVRSNRNPIPSTAGGATPIQHVVLIVRENRTFDQVLGDTGADEGRGQSQINAQAAYTIFGRTATPNAHALVGDPLPGTRNPAFATSDNFFSDGEASIQGHFWTADATVNDYVEKSWPQYYSPRKHIYDPISTIGEPRNCSIFQSALARQVASGGRFSFRDYGELIGIANPSVTASLLPVGNASPAVPELCSAIPNANIDLAGGTNLNLDTDNRQTAQSFLADVGLNADGSPTVTANPATNYLRNFSYLIMAGDHTGGLAFADTPRARVAQNDAGLGLIVQALSHSRYWPSTAIFVVEDDSQDGLDHVDGHRNLLYVISPYAKHVGSDGKPGYVGHTHYSQASVLKTIELLCGFPFLSTYDQNASALYDLFQNKDAADQLTATDLSPFTVEPAPSFVDETSAHYTSSNAALAAVPAAESRTLHVGAPDEAGPLLEVINWQLAHPGTRIPAPLAREMDRRPAHASAVS